jgi:hypothetical protein
VSESSSVKCNVIEDQFYTDQIQMAIWPVLLAISLSHGVDGPWNEHTLQPQFGSGASDFFVAREIVFSGFIAGELDTVPPNGFTAANRGGKFRDHSLIKPLNFLNWARSKHWKLHPLLTAFLDTALACSNSKRDSSELILEPSTASHEARKTIRPSISALMKMNSWRPDEAVELVYDTNLRASDPPAEPQLIMDEAKEQLRRAIVTKALEPHLDQQTGVTYVKRKEFLGWAIQNGWAVPGILLKSQDLTEAWPQKIRNDAATKIRCEAIAQFKWTMSPDMTTAEMAESDALQKVAGGEAFSIDTVKTWINPLRPGKRGPGRPPKT